MARVLIIDDDVHVLKSLTAVLESQAHDVTTVSSIAKFEALEALASQFDLVLLDIWLTDGSGLSVLEVIKDQDPDLPVIVISGGGPGKTLEQAIAFADLKGANQVLIKPFRNKELLAAVRDVL